MPNVSHIRGELASVRVKYETISDCIEGGLAVKRRGTVYLPQPNPEDKSPENTTRYVQYVARAMFYNATRYTLQGYVGTVFNRSPVLDLPEAMEALRDDADGAGVACEQMARRSLALTASYGRSGLYVDYPRTEGPTSRADMLAGNLRPTLTVYDPLDIINWREKVIGGKRKLSLVVLVESAIVEDDGFQFKTEPQYRVLRLTEGGIYEVEVFLGKDFRSQGVFYPRDAVGKYFDEIPFKFIGSENNDTTVDNPPMYDLAALNIGHYRNSADYEESAFIVGQPTPWFAGLTTEWVKEVMTGTVYLGSRAVIPLPENGSAGMLQAEPNTMPMEAMKHKEEQMIALGARLVQKSNPTRTATEAAGDQATSQSALAICATNVSQAYLWALKFAAKFIGANEEEIDFALSTQFDLENMSPEEVKMVIETWQKNGITTSEMRDRLSAGGIAKLPFDEYEAERDKDVEYALANMPELQPDPNQNTGGNE